MSCSSANTSCEDDDVVEAYLVADEVKNESEQFLRQCYQLESDWSKRFKGIDRPSAKGMRAHLFYRNPEYASILTQGKVTKPKYHVPDGATLQFLYHDGNTYSCLQAVSASLAKVPRLINEEIHSNIDSFVQNYVRQVIWILSQATASPINDSFGHISLVECCALAGYDLGDCMLRRFVKRVTKDTIPVGDTSHLFFTIKERDTILSHILCKKICRDFKYPNYDKLLDRYSHAVIHRQKRTPNPEHPWMMQDYIQWCFHEPVPEHLNNADDDGSSSGHHGEAQIAAGKSQVGHSRPLRKARLLAELSQKQLKLSGMSTNNAARSGRKRPRGKGRGQQSAGSTHRSPGSASAEKKHPPDSSNKPAPEVLATLPREAHQNNHSDSSVEKQLLATRYHNSNDSCAVEKSLDSGAVGAVDGVVLAVTNKARSTISTATITRTLPLHEVVTHGAFISRLAQLGIAVQAVLVGPDSTRIIRLGFILPVMKIVEPVRLSTMTTKAGDTVPNETATFPKFGIPRPGDIVEMAEAKMSLGFASVKDHRNQHNCGFLGINSIFVSDHSQLSNVTEMLAMIHNKLNLHEPLQSLDLFGYGGCPQNKPLCWQDHNDTYNKQLIYTMRQKLPVSLWVTANLKSNAWEDSEKGGDVQPYILCGWYVIDSYSYSRFTVEEFHQFCKHRQGLVQLDSCPNDRLRFLLCHHFTFHLRLVENPYEQCHVGYSSTSPPRVLSWYLDSSPSSKRSPQFIEFDIPFPDNYLDIDHICEIATNTFFRDPPNIRVVPPFYLHESILQHYKKVPDVKTRRRLTLSLIQLVSMLNIESGECLSSALVHQLHCMLTYVLERTKSPRHIRSLIGDLLLDPIWFQDVFTTLLPSNFVVASERNSDAHDLICRRFGGSVVKASDEAFLGVKKILEHDESTHSSALLEPLKVVTRGGQCIHYRAIGTASRASSTEVQWNNLDTAAGNDHSMKTFVSEMRAAVRQATGSDDDVKFIHHANRMGSRLPDPSAVHPDPQLPHCDTDSLYRNKCVNPRTGLTRVCTAFFPVSEDGVIVVLFPLDVNKDDATVLDDPYFVYQPKQHYLVVNGACWHSGGLCLGEEVSTFLPENLEVTNDRMQVFFVPEEIGECNTNETFIGLLPKKSFIKENDMDLLRNNLLNGKPK
jgi:hypothetical protein